MSWPLARETVRYNGDTQEEDVRWIGKPWRRLELLTIRSFYRGECIDVMRDATATLGLRRLGWQLHVAITRASVLDYSDEPHQ